MLATVFGVRRSSFTRVIIDEAKFPLREAGVQRAAMEVLKAGSRLPMASRWSSPLLLARGHINDVETVQHASVQDS